MRRPRHVDVKPPTPLDVPFMIRLLNEATGTNLRVREYKGFRPVLTICHGFDETTVNAANFLVEKIHEYEERFLEEITWKSLLALVSTKHVYRIKADAVNFAIKWLIAHRLEPSEFNAVLMSIHLPFLSMCRIAEVRLGIYLYLTTPELLDFFIIGFGANGYIYMKNRQWNDNSKSLMEVVRMINKITDSHQNDTWPKTTKRYDPEAPRWKKGKIIHPDPVKSWTELKNPLYRWNFNPYDFPFQSSESVEPIKANNRPPPITPAYPPQVSNMVRPTKEKTQNKVDVAKWVNQIHAPESIYVTTPQPAQRMLMKPPGYQSYVESIKSSTIPKSTSSGYQSMISSRKSAIAKAYENPPKVANAPHGKTVYEAVKTVDGKQDFKSSHVQNQRSKHHNDGNNNKGHQSHQPPKNQNQNHRRIPVHHRRITGPPSENHCQNQNQSKKENSYRNIPTTEDFYQNRLKSHPHYQPNLEKIHEKTAPAAAPYKNRDHMKPPETPKATPKFFFDPERNCIVNTYDSSLS